MGSHGSAHARFVRALENGSLLMVKAAAMECGRLSLPEALGYTLYLAGSLEVSTAEFERVAVRWHARWCAEVAASADEAALALSSLRALRGGVAATARGTLLDLADARGQYELVRVLESHHAHR